MAYSYKNKNGKRVTGSAAFNHLIKLNGGFENHNRKMALFGAEHADEFLSMGKLLKGPIRKLFSKKK